MIFIHLLVSILLPCKNSIFCCESTKANAFSYTYSTKINRPGYNISMYWTNFRQPNAHAQQNIFGKTLTEVGSPHIYASVGTFCVQIGQLFAAQWVFKHSEEFRIRRHFPTMRVICQFSNFRDSMGRASSKDIVEKRYQLSKLLVFGCFLDI